MNVKVSFNDCGVFDAFVVRINALVHLFDVHVRVSRVREVYTGQHDFLCWCFSNVVIIRSLTCSVREIFFLHFSFSNIPTTCMSTMWPPNHYFCRPLCFIEDSQPICILQSPLVALRICHCCVSTSRCFESRRSSALCLLLWSFLYLSCCGCSSRRHGLVAW